MSNLKCIIKKRRQRDLHQWAKHYKKKKMRLGTPEREAHARHLALRKRMHMAATMDTMTNNHINTLETGRLLTARRCLHEPDAAEDDGEVVPVDAGAPRDRTEEEEAAYQQRSEEAQSLREADAMDRDGPADNLGVF